MKASCPLLSLWQASLEFATRKYIKPLIHPHRFQKMNSKVETHKDSWKTYVTNFYKLSRHCIDDLFSKYVEWGII